MQVKSLTYKYLRHAVLLLGMVCLLFAGRNAYSSEPAFDFDEVHCTQDDGTLDQPVAYQDNSTSDLKHHLTTIHRRHHSRRYMEKPTGREYQSSFVGSSLSPNNLYHCHLRFGVPSCTIRLRYYILLFLYALF